MRLSRAANPQNPSACCRIARSPMTKGRAKACTSGASSALTVISGPIPAGSPMVTARTGVVSVMASYSTAAWLVRSKKSFRHQRGNAPACVGPSRRAWRLVGETVVEAAEGVGDGRGCADGAAFGHQVPPAEPAIDDSAQGDQRHDLALDPQA